MGTPALDSTHQLRGFSAMEGDDRRQVAFPLDPGAERAMRHVVWREIDRTYREAAERIGNVLDVFDEFRSIFDKSVAGSAAG